MVLLVARTLQCTKFLEHPFVSLHHALLTLLHVNPWCCSLHLHCIHSSSFCDRGVLRCLRTTCPETVCRLGQELVTPQGECCPKCVHPTPLPALCVLEGGQVMIEGETRRQEADPCITWCVHVCILYVIKKLSMLSVYIVHACASCMSASVHCAYKNIENCYSVQYNAHHSHSFLPFPLHSTCMPNGSAQCFSESCSVPCPFGEKPVRQDGQCCPTCQKTKSP